MKTNIQFPTFPLTTAKVLANFRQYLISLGLSGVSRKLYLADIAKLLSHPIFSSCQLETYVNPQSYFAYLQLSENNSPLTRRTLASIHHFGTYLHATYQIPNPTLSLSLSFNQSNPAKLSFNAHTLPFDKYIKIFTNHLISIHLSSQSIKSYKSDISQYLIYAHKTNPSTKLSELLSEENIRKYHDILIQSHNQSPATIVRKLKTIRRFVQWMAQEIPVIRMSDNSKVSASGSNSYNLSTPVLPPNPNPARKQQSLTLSLPWLPDHSTSFVKNNNYRNHWLPRFKKPSLRSLLTASILLVIFSTLSILTYRQFASGARLTAAFPSTPVTPNRQLSFQGRLENASGTPVTSATNFVFKLFDASSGGTELYSSGTCSITPDTDGVFSTQIGSTCGAGITSSVFSENANVWLAVTVGAETLSPRQQIATVAYALNAETVQGFPITATVSALRNTVVPMNQWGEIIIAEQSPRLKGVSGTFQISAPTLTLSTASGTNGNITLAPDGTGQVNLNGKTTTTNFFNVSNAQLTTGSLITGTVANNNTGYNLLNLLSGSSPTSKFSIDYTGNTTLATGADLFIGTIGLNDVGSSNTTSGASLIGTYDEFDNSNSTNVQGVLNDLDAAITTAGVNLWTDSGTLTYLTSTTDDFAIGGSSLTGSMFALDESAGNFYFGYDNSANPTLNFEATDGDAGEFGFNTNDSFFFSNANVGIGTTAPGYLLSVDENDSEIALSVTGGGSGNPLARFARDVGTNGFIDISAASGDPQLLFDVQDSGTQWSIGTDDDDSDKFKIGYGGYVSSATTALTILNTGNVGIGTTSPSHTLDLAGSLGKSTQATTGYLDSARNVTPWDQTFEENITGWSQINTTTLTQSSAQAYEGTYSFKLQRGNLTGSGGAAYTLGTSLKAGRVYTLSGYYKMVNGSGTAAIKLNSNGANAYTNGTTYTDKTLTNASNWTYFSMSITASTITSGNNYVWLAHSMPDTTQEIYFDNLVFSEGSLPLNQYANAKTSLDGLYTYFGGNVGIGTTGPDQKLDVVGNINWGNNGEGILGWDADSASIRSTGGKALSLGANNSIDQLFIDTSGNVGIGDTTPDHKLDVAGNIGLNASSYINFGDTDGTSGYGFRDNAGTIEFKNSAGVWAGIGSGGGGWTDAGTYLYPTSGEVLGNSASAGANKLAGIYLSDSAPLTFGTNNDFSFAFNNSTSTLGSTLGTGIRFGINTTNALATFDVRGNLGTIPVASIAGSTSQAALIVDNTVGDLFTASSSGLSRFVITQNGNVGIGVTNPTNKLEIGGATSTISNSSGDITLDSASNFIAFSGDSIGNILNGYFAGEVGIGLSDAIAKLDVHGAVTGKALVMFDELGDQDLLTASASSVTRFRLRNDGSLSLDGDYLNFALTEGSSGYGIRDNAGVMEFKSLSGAWTAMGAGGASWWDQVNGTIQPYNTTVDLLLGGTATTSAKFAVLNMNSGTPTASISAGTNGALYLTASGGIATTAKQTLALGDSTTTGNIILQGGNVGIGVTNPTEKLEVNGYVVGQRFEDSASSAYYLDPAATGTSLSIDGNIVGNGAFYLSTGNDAVAVSIGTTGAGKLDAGTIDPPYTINGEKFATYMTSMTGVKEETTGTVAATEYIAGKGYRATLDFANSLTGSDLWLFSKTTSLQSQLDKLVVLTTAAGNSKTWYELDAEQGKLYLFSTSPTMVSYRLTAPRFDADNWQNTRDSDSLGFVIDSPNTWSVSEEIASLYSSISETIQETITNSLSTSLISPLASNSAIVITADPSSAPNTLPSGNTYLGTDPLLIVDGTIDSATISARTAYLNEIVADTITARDIVADTITANNIIGLDAKIASLSGISNADLDSITDRIKDRLNSLTDPATAQDLPIPAEATPSSELNTNLDLFSSLASGSATLSSADIDFATINNYLAVIGSATITDLSVTNNFYTNTINSQSGILALQNLGGLINLGNNTLIVDSTGSVVVNGDLYVNGRILAQSASLDTLELGNAPESTTSSALGNLLAVYNENGKTVATIDASGSASLASLTTNMITIASSGTATDSSALSSLLGTTKSNATAGVATLTTPNTELTIESPHITTNSLVYLTPTTNTDNKVVFVKAKNSCNQESSTPCTPSFTIGIDAPAGSDISFNWWIIQLSESTPTEPASY